MSALRQSFTALVLRIGAAVAALASVTVLGRVLPAHDYGRIALILSALTFGTAICARGMPMVLLRFSGEGVGAALMRRALWMALVPAVLIAMTGLAAYHSGWDGFLAAGLWLLPPFALSEIASAALRAQGRFVSALAPRDILWRFALIVLAPWGGVAVLTGAAVLLWIVALTQISCVAKAVIQAPLPKNFAPVAQRIWVTNLAAVGLANIDVLVVGALFGPVTAGAYFAAARIATLPSFALNAVNTALGPRIARHLATNATADLRDDLRIGSTMATIPAVIACILFATFGPWLLALMGEGFTPMYPVLVLLSLGQLLNGLTGAAGLLLNMSGNEAAHARLSLWAVVLAPPVAFGSAAMFGPIGLAAAMTATTAAYEIALWATARRLTGFDGSILGWRRA